MPNRVVYSFIASDKFTAVARRISRQTERVRKSMKKLGPTAKFAGAQVTRAFRGMGVAVRGFMATSLGPLLAAFAGIAGVMKFFSAGTGFQDAMADLSAITGSTGKDLDFLRQEALRMGKATKIGSAEVAIAIKQVASAKSELLEDPQALIKVTEQMLLLKNATGLDIAEAASIGVGALNQFGVGADQASRFVNVLAASAKIGAAEVGDIGLALKNVGSVAEIAALSFEETNAAVQVLAKANLKGAEAGTKLRGVLLKLNKALPFDQVGGFANALDILAAKNLNLAQLQEIFGEEMVAAAIPLLKNTKLLREFTKGVTGTSEATIQAKVRLETMTAKLRGVGVTITNVLIRAFDKLAPQFDEQIEKMGRFFNSIKPEQVTEFASRIGAVVRGVVQLGSIAFALFKILAPVVSLVLKPLQLLLELLDRLTQIPGALKLLGTFGADAVRDLLGGGGGGGELAFATPTPVETSSNITLDMNINDPRGVIGSTKATTSGKSTGLNVARNMVKER